METSRSFWVVLFLVACLFGAISQIGPHLFPPRISVYKSVDGQTVPCHHVSHNVWDC